MEVEDGEKGQKRVRTNMAFFYFGLGSEEGKDDVGQGEGREIFELAAAAGVGRGGLGKCLQWGGVTCLPVETMGS